MKTVKYVLSESSYYTHRNRGSKLENIRSSIGTNTRSIRECGSTLYVGMARAVSPTNTNFRLTFLLTRLQEVLYEDFAV